MKAFLILSLSLFVLAGCGIAPAGEPPAHFGNAVKQNIAAQVINPDAPVVKRAPEHVGSRTAIAQQRYITDTVETPEATATSGGSR